MKEPKNMTVKELIDKVIFCAFHLYTDKNLNIPVDELLSRYEEQEKKIAVGDKALELMVEKYIDCDVCPLYSDCRLVQVPGCNKRIRQHFKKVAMKELEEADEGFC